jgi:hypothetical protein
MRAPIEQLTVEADPAILAGVRPGSPAARDWQIVHWIGRIGIVTIEQLQRRFRLGRTVAYRRTAACIEGRLLERVETLRGVPALLRATRRGLRYVGLRLPVAQAAPEQVGHWIACGAVALELEGEFGTDALRGEREIRALERGRERPVASAELGETASGARRLHLADLVVLGERTLAVEVELTPKAPRRLEEIVRAWRRARWVDEIRYYVPSGSTRAGLERAISRAHAGERIELRRIEGVLS